MLTVYEGVVVGHGGTHMFFLMSDNTICVHFCCCSSSLPRCNELHHMGTKTMAYLMNANIFRQTAFKAACKSFILLGNSIRVTKAPLICCELLFFQALTERRQKACNEKLFLIIGSSV